MNKVKNNTLDLVKLNENSIRFIFYVACNIHNGVFFTSCKCVHEVHTFFTCVFATKKVVDSAAAVYKIISRAEPIVER